MQIGIDIGTSAVKVVLCDGSHLIQSTSAPLKVHSPSPGWSEQHPNDWWDATLKALSQLKTLEEVEAIGLSGQMHGAVLLDQAHEILRPAILWNDNRSVDMCATLKTRVPDIGTRAGVLPLPGFTAPKIMWLKKYEPDIYTRIKHILLPKDYVGFCLHGNMATDISDAAGTLWLDQTHRTWCDHLCQNSDTEPDWLPKLHYGTQICGTVTHAAAQQTGLRAGVRVFAGGGDAATGAMSIGVTEPGQAFMSLVTTGQLFVANDCYCPNPEAYVHAFAHTVPNRWYQMAALLNGARPLSWLGTLLGLSVPALLAEAAQANTSALPIFLPYLTGERSPHGDPHVRASFALLNDSTTRAELALSVVEAIAFSFADATQSFGEGIVQVPHLIAIGGGSQSPLLLQKIANATGHVIVQNPNAATGAALGAAYLACLGMGDTPLAPTHTDGVVFHPQADTALEARKELFRSLYHKIGKGQI